MRLARLPLIMLLATLLLICAAAPALADSTPAPTYKDTAGHWAEQAIETWSDYDVIQGADGHFRPDDGIIRGEMALILDRVMRYSLVPENNFLDLPDTWYTEAVLKLNAAQVMLGHNGLARPTDYITRQEAALMIARATGLDTISDEGLPLPYADAAEIADWALHTINLLTERGYITDSPELFRPNDNITRAETVNLIDNIIQGLLRASGLFNRFIPGNAVVAGKNVLLLNCVIAGDLMIAGGAESVILQNTQVLGNIINRSWAEVHSGSGNDYQPDNIYYGDKTLPRLANVAVNPYAGVDFLADKNGRLEYRGSAGTSIAGIDVSEHQSKIDWQRVKADGIDFAIIRAGYRGYTQGLVTADALFAANMQGALAAGLDVGVYFYSQAINKEEAAMEAQMVLDMIAPYEITYPVVYDWEIAGTANARTNGLDSATLTDCAITFAESVANAGYTPMIYYNSELAYMKYNLSRLTAYDGWYAGYNATPEFYYTFRMWQYTSSGSVSGIEGRVDMNICFQPN